MAPFHPPDYSTWDSVQQKMWDQIPFDANSYYLHYLPPGVSPRNQEWSNEETEKLLACVKVTFILSFYGLGVFSSWEVGFVLASFLGKNGRGGCFQIQD